LGSDLHVKLSEVLEATGVSENVFGKFCRQVQAAIQPVGKSSAPQELTLQKSKVR
jgi:hypothetical protein